MTTETHDHDRGLSFDLATLLDRRRAIRLIAGIGLVALGACANDDSSGSASTSSSSSTTSTGSSSSSTTSTGASCDDVIPTETAGPYPGDGSNGPNILDESGIVRRDITSSIGSASGKAAGIGLTINLTIQDQAKGCAPLAGAAVYLWHCDREGRYSMYSQGVTSENYLRGVQETDKDGRVTFTSIFPAAYPGRWPHIHFEVYPTLAGATSSGKKLGTSQLALPEDVCKLVYATTGYEASVRNLASTSLARDMVFADGYGQQMAATTGSVGAGYTAELNVAV